MGTTGTTTGGGHGEDKDPPMLAAARMYTRRGWRVVPVRPREKGVTLSGWQQMRLNEDDLPKWFGGAFPHIPHNIGILTGEPSGGLVDVDCDAPEAALAAAELLPPTGLISGRVSSPASHYWYNVEWLGKDLPATAKFADLTPQYPLPHGEGEAEAEADGRQAEHRSMLIELRSTGCQTLAPPSIHPSGEFARWEWEHVTIGRSDPDRIRKLQGKVTVPELTRAVAKVAAVALLARHWPAVGQRDEAAKDLAGLLLRGGWAEEEVDQFTRLVAKIAGDEEWQKRGKARGTARKLAEGAHVTGGRSLAARLSGHGADGVRIVARLVVWLGLREPDGAGGGWSEAGELGGLGSAYVAEGGQLSDVAPFAGGGHLGEIGQIGQLLGAVTPTPARPLWGGRLYLGKLAICDGDPGHGKTLLALDLAARITTGREMPDGSAAIGPAGVVYFTAEDDPADTLRPRLDAAGGDPNRLLVVTTVAITALDGVSSEHQPTFRDLALIERAIARVEAKLVIFDPFMAYLDSQTNSFRDQDVRAVLAPLARLAERTGAAFFLIRHLNKGGGGHAVYRGGGSIGIIGAARSGLLVGRDPDDAERRVVASTKNNLGMPPASLAYRVIPSASGAPIIQWEGESPHDARALLVGEEASPSEMGVGRACAFLSEALAQGPQPERVIEEHARATGISERTLKRAKKRLGIVSGKAGFSNGWIWSLSSDDALGERPPTEQTTPKGSNAPEGGQVNGVAPFAAVGPLGAPDNPSAVCYFTGGPHRYGEARNPHGRRRCLDCWNAQPDGEDEDEDGPQNGQEVGE